MWRHIGHGVMNFARNKQTNKHNFAQIVNNYPLFKKSYNRQVKEKQE
jgi:hypothetical protein